MLSRECLESALMAATSKIRMNLVGKGSSWRIVMEYKNCGMIDGFK